MASLSKKAIRNAFDNVWFGDLKYGILGSVPAEMLHVGGTGILKNIFEYLDSLIEGTKDKETFDDLHKCLVRDAQCQSERDFPRMAVCNGITDGAKMCGSERVGNCFILLCLFHTQQADRGCAVGAIFWGAGGLGVLIRVLVTLRGLRISEKKEILRKLILL